MSNTLTTTTTPLWRPGNKGNIEFVTSFKRLEMEDPQTSKSIELREGFKCQNGEFEYHVGRNQFGLWLSRRRLGLEGLHNIEKDDKDKPPTRPVGFANANQKQQLTDDEINILKQFVALLKVVK